MEVNYESYRVEDFLEDANFIAWMKYRSPELEEYWSKWKASEPANLAAFKQAVTQLKIILSAERIEPVKGDKEELLQKIFISIGNAEEKVILFKPGFRRWMIAASAAAILIIIGALWFITTKQDTKAEFTTAYGEIKRIVYPTNLK